MNTIEQERFRKLYEGMDELAKQTRNLKRIIEDATLACQLHDLPADVVEVITHVNAQMTIVRGRSYDMKDGMTDYYIRYCQPPIRS